MVNYGVETKVFDFLNNLENMEVPFIYIYFLIFCIIRGFKYFTLHRVSIMDSGVPWKL